MKKLLTLILSVMVLLTACNDRASENNSGLSSVVSNSGSGSSDPVSESVSDTQSEGSSSTGNDNSIEENSSSSSVSSGSSSPESSNSEPKKEQSSSTSQSSSDSVPASSSTSSSASSSSITSASATASNTFSSSESSKVPEKSSSSSSATNTGSSTKFPDQTSTGKIPEQPSSKEENDLTIKITVGSRAFSATLYDNATARAFKARLPMTLEMEELNGNEKYYYLPNSLPTNAARPSRINNGDIMLYGSSCVVIFYESFSTSYSYTPIGKIDDPSGLAAALGSGGARVTFE